MFDLRYWSVVYLTVQLKDRNLAIGIPKCGIKNAFCLYRNKRSFRKSSTATQHRSDECSQMADSQSVRGRWADNCVHAPLNLFGVGAGMVVFNISSVSSGRGFHYNIPEHLLRGLARFAARSFFLVEEP